MLFRTNERLIICGQTGSGKTYFAKKLIQKIKKYIIYDSQYEFSEYGKVVHNLTDLKKTAKKVSRIIYQPEKDYISIDLDAVCKFIVDFIRGCVLIIDELHLFAPEFNIPPNLKIIITTGRRMGVGFIGICQRPQLIDKTFITQAQHIIIFKITQRDLDYLAGFVGKKIYQISQKSQYSYAYFDTKTGFLTFFNPI